MSCFHDISNMDYDLSLTGVPDLRVNRLCMKCYQHWDGPEGAVVEYTLAEWDARVLADFIAGAEI